MNLTIKEEKGFKYIEEGEGEVLILLHGLMGALSNWQEVVNKFKTKYKVIIPMLPIYDMPIITTDVKSISIVLAKYVKFKGIDNCVLIGNSLGGNVALMYVLKHQKTVQALVLAGRPGLYEDSFGGSFPKR